MSALVVVAFHSISKFLAYGSSQFGTLFWKGVFLVFIATIPNFRKTFFSLGERESSFDNSRLYVNLSSAIFIDDSSMEDEGVNFLKYVLLIVMFLKGVIWS